MSNRKEHYFKLKLTEGEHGFVENILQEECQNLNLELKYYRKLKTGHIPLIREVKILGDFGELMKVLYKHNLDKYLEK